MSEERIAQLRAEILERTRELIELREAPKPFTPGESVVPYAGRVYDADEVEAGVASMLDFWLTLGPEGKAFQRQLARYLDVRAKKGVVVSAEAMSSTCMMRPNQ